MGHSLEVGQCVGALLTVLMTVLAAAASFSFSRADTCWFRERTVLSCSYNICTRHQMVYSDTAIGMHILWMYMEHCVLAHVCCACCAHVCMCVCAYVWVTTILALQMYKGG